ncbi:hypothetical protein FD754_003865 [Muntiacus muntjak]|uniref:Muscular LMNA interacting protein n=1 Tax=Muntiacus muntjak TaxID=9888 RepID=A0A5N3WD99_MUNMU|nr:hypothetical protein FD754_003865 [Muntiacus muntjak]
MEGQSLNLWAVREVSVSSGDSEAKPLIFTFVPTVRRLPTHSQLGDTSKYIVKIPEEPSDKTPETVNRLTSPTASEQLACKPPAFSFVSPTNQKTPPAPGELAGASVLEEFHSRRLDARGALVEETTTYFQTSAHSAPFFAPKGMSSTSQVPQPAQVSGPSTAQQNPGQPPEVLKKTVTSNVLSPKESPRASSPSPASGASLKSGAASYIPVRIVTHSLSPSPKAFPSPFHGSSSTVCSQASSSGSLSRPGVKPLVPSRLSVLTAILKSSPSHQRPLSPASCPTFSLNSLASSTLTLDQKAKQTPPTPKKSLSSCSLRSGSPEQRENPVSHLSQPSFPFSSPTKAAPSPQASALSPPKQGSSSFASVIVEKMPSPTLKSSPVTSQLQTGTSSSVGLPPVPPSFSPLSSKGRQDADSRGPGKPRDICSHASPSPSSTSSSVSPPTNPRARLSSPERRYHPSPALSNLINRSRSAQAPASGQGQTLSTPRPAPVSSSSSASLPRLGPSALPLANPPTKARQLSPSALHPDLTLPSRLGKPESSVTEHRSSVSAPSPPFSLTRTQELSAPCTLSMSAGPENKKPKNGTTASFPAVPIEAWQATVHRITKDRTQLKRLSTHAHIHIYFCYDRIRLVILFSPFSVPRNCCSMNSLLSSFTPLASLESFCLWFTSLSSLSARSPKESGPIIQKMIKLKHQNNPPSSISKLSFKGFGIVKAIYDFLELSCFFDDLVDVGNLISGSSGFSKTILNIWKFMVHVLLKHDLENFELYCTSVLHKGPLLMGFPRQEFYARHVYHFVYFSCFSPTVFPSTSSTLAPFWGF